MGNPSLGIRNPKVFISYSHDSERHQNAVLAFAQRLRRDGIDTVIDQYVEGTPAQGWPRWMLDELDDADFVLIICTEIYYNRFRGRTENQIGRGVNWEGALITQEIYNKNSRTDKFLPVFLSDLNPDWIPEPLRSGTSYALTSERTYSELYDVLLKQSGTKPSELGELKRKKPVAVEPMTFPSIAGEFFPQAIQQTRIDAGPSSRVRHHGVSPIKRSLVAASAIVLIFILVFQVWPRGQLGNQPQYYAESVQTKELSTKIEKNIAAILVKELDEKREIPAVDAWTEKVIKLAIKLQRDVKPDSSLIFHSVPVKLTADAPIINVEFWVQAGGSGYGQRHNNGEFVNLLGKITMIKPDITPIRSGKIEVKIGDASIIPFPAGFTLPELSGQ